MGNVLEDLVRGVQNFGVDAAAAVDRATRNTLEFAGSGVNASGQIIGPIAERFGTDPGQFVLNVARETRSRSIELLRRVAQRTGKLKYEFPTPQGKRTVTAVPNASAPANQVALTLVLCAIDAPGTMTEESGRMSAGLPVKERGLAGFNVYPQYPSAALRDRGFLGFDDAAVLAVVVPIIIAIAVKVLPLLISAASNAIAEATKPQVTPEQAAAQQQAEAEAAEKEKQTQTLKTVAIVSAIVLVLGGGVYLMVRRKS